MFIALVTELAKAFEKAGFVEGTVEWKKILTPNDATGVLVESSQFNGNGSYEALKLTNTQSFAIVNNMITGYETGISLTNSVNSLNINGVECLMRYNEVSNCNTGIELYSSSSSFYSNDIHDNVYGVKLFNNSYTNFDNTNQEEQRFKNCDSIEVYVSENSFPTIFRDNIIWDDNKQGIPLFYWDVTTYSNQKPRDIRYNCWGDKFDYTDDLYPSNAFLWSPDNPCTGKSGSPPRGEEEDEYLYLAGLNYFSNKDYSNAEITFKELIQTYPDSRFAIAALHELFALEHYTNQDFYSLNSYYATITPMDSNLFNTADFLATRCLVKERDWQPAVDWYENRIENPPSYQDSVFAVIDLGEIHLMMEADTLGKGKAGYFCYYRIPNIKPKSKMQYEENKSSLLATLPQIKKTKKDVSGEISVVGSEIKRGVLGECVPNPINGNATISYELFAGGVVEIQLFNSIGQLVKSLPQGTLTKGNYKTTISVVGMPVGVYHYTLVVNGERVDGKKVVVN